MKFDSDNIEKELEKVENQLEVIRTLQEIAEIRDVLEEEYDYAIQAKGRILKDDESSYANTLLDYMKTDLDLDYEFYTEEDKHGDEKRYVRLYGGNGYDDSFIIDDPEKDWEEVVRYYLEILFLERTGHEFHDLFPKEDILKMKIDHEVDESFNFDSADKTEQEIKKAKEDTRLVLKKAELEEAEKKMPQVREALALFGYVPGMPDKASDFVYGVWKKGYEDDNEAIIKITNDDLAESGKSYILYVWQKFKEFYLGQKDEETSISESFDFSEVSESYNLPLAGTYGDTQNNGNPYFEYSIKPLVSNLSQKSGRGNVSKEAEKILGPGDYVTGICPIDNKEHSGKIYRILKNPDATISWVYILTDDTKEFIRLEPDTVYLDTPYPIERKELADPIKYKRNSWY